MAEVSEYMFKHQEVVTALIKKQGIHKGRWALSVRFGFAAANVGGEDKVDVNPAAVVPLMNIGLRLVTDPNEKSNIIVDAAEANPA